MRSQNITRYHGLYFIWQFYTCRPQNEHIAWITLMPTAVPAADTVLSKWWYLLAVVQSAAVLLHPDTFSSEQILPFGFAELYCCAVPVIEHRVCRPVSVLCHGTI